MKIKILFFGLVFLGIINVAALITIGYYHIVSRKEAYCNQESGHCSLLHEKLDLTEKQVKELTAYQKDFQKKAEPLNKSLNVKEGQLVELLMESKPDLSQIDSVVVDINSTQLILKQEVVKHLLAEKELFTEEQKQTFFTLIQNMLVKEKCHRDMNNLPMIGTESNRK